MTLTDADKRSLRSITRSHYDLQNIRIQVGNRLCANFRAILGQEPSKPTEDLTPEAKHLLKTLKDEYSRLADAVATHPPARWSSMLETHEGLIQNPFDLALAKRYVELVETEKDALAEITTLVAQFPIWTAFLKDVHGLGPLMGAIIISELDPHTARHVSSFWALSGLDVAADGRGRSRRPEHLVMRQYTNKQGDPAERLGLSFNPFLKTKLIGVLGSNFIKMGGHYRDVYDDYKRRLENHAIYGIAQDAERIAAAKKEGKRYAPKLHRHAMATRYMVKIFLQDLWIAWRTLDGLPVGEPYAVAKLGYPPHGADPTTRRDDPDDLTWLG